MVGQKPHGDPGQQPAGDFTEATPGDVTSKVVGLSILDAALELKDRAYRERDHCVAALARLAVLLGWNVGLGKHDENDATWEPDWMHIVFIDLPTGQVSWHFHDSELPLFQDLPSYNGQWDGHTTKQKYERLALLHGAGK